jgi:beta-N-acetylhexosaminidase
MVKDEAMKIYFVLLVLLITSSYSEAKIQLSDLTLDQKIGQLFMVAAVADEQLAWETIAKKSYRMDKKYITELIEDYHIGGIIFLGKSDVAKQQERTECFQSLSETPLLIGQDLEPGRVGKSRFEDFIYPNNQALGSFDDLSNTYDIATEIGQFCSRLGVHINFAPVADVNNNPKNPVIDDRSFGDNPQLVLRHAIAFARGLSHSGIIACAKHFPGHGDTLLDSHITLPQIDHDRERLDRIELYPFKELIKKGIPAIMIGHLAVVALESEKNIPASLSKNIVTELLRKEFSFEGIIITDALDMAGVTHYYADGDAELRALLAGNDILLCPIDVPKAIEAIKNALKSGIITEKAIDMHVERILKIKNKVFN